MSLLEQAKALYAQVKDMDWEERRAALKAVPEALSDAYDAYRKDLMYLPANAQPNPKEILSPSGRYKLVVTSYTSGPGTWNVTEGRVFRVDSDKPIASIRRNYHSFPYCFVEGHADEHDYMIGGEDYQGQTVLQLDTGEKRGLLPEEAKQGHGFCWASYNYNEATKLLVVHGCYWAAPYETRFYDFSDPMNGWPLLEIVPQDEENGDAYIDDDATDPTFAEDGTVTTYQTKYGAPGEDENNQYDDSDEEDDDGNPRPKRFASTRTFKREGLKMVEISSWVSEAEAKKRADQAEWNRKYNEYWDNYKKNDPLYLKAKELAAQEPFKPMSYVSQGNIGPSWCPDFKENEYRICWDIHHASTFRVALEIATKTGPVKLIMSNSKEKSVERFFMEHSVESIEKAFVVAREFLAGDP